MLVVNELTIKIQKANRLLERLKFGDPGLQPIRPSASDFMETVDPTSKAAGVKPDHIRFLRQMTQTSLSKLPVSA